MRMLKTGGSRGQTLLLVAIAMLLLLGITAVAIDAGHLYRERRQMQNAADSGALAGAYEICFGTPDEYPFPEDVALDYAEENDADRALSSATIVTTNTIEVIAQRNVATYFASVVGIDSVEIGAVAQAACGPATSACGLWPIAFDQGYFEQLTDLGCGADHPFYVWMATRTEDQFACLEDSPPSPTNAFKCDCFPDNNANGYCDCGGDPNGNGICDPGEGDGDGEKELLPMPGRAWVDFSGFVTFESPEDECARWEDGDSNSCDTNELRCWITSDSGAKVRIPSCIPGDMGVKAGVHTDVQQRADLGPPYNTVAIPLFDYAGCPGDPCGGPNGQTFWVVDFGCIDILDWLKPNQHCLPRADDPADGNDDCENPGGGVYQGAVIKVAVSCNECATWCGGTGGGAPCEGDVCAVSILK